jgi:hypothetical protein
LRASSRKSVEEATTTATAHSFKLRSTVSKILCAGAQCTATACRATTANSASQSLPLLKNWRLKALPCSARALKILKNWNSTKVVKATVLAFAAPESAKHRQDLPCVQRSGLLLDLRQVLRLQLLGGAEQVLEGFAQHGRAHHPAARVVAPGYLPQRVGGGKRKRHAGGGTAHAAQGFARCLAQEATEQLAAKLLQVLRGQAHPGGGDEFLDVALVQLYAVGLANAIHHLHLQRNDGHRRPRLRQQLQCAVEQGVVEGEAHRQPAPQPPDRA